MRPGQRVEAGCTAVQLLSRTMRCCTLYAGSILWSMWTGQVPWAGLSDPQIMMAASHGRGLVIPTNAPAGYQVTHQEAHS